MAAPWVLFISVVCFSGITAVAPATVICCIARSEYFSYELLQRVLDCACRAETADCCYLPNHACSCVTTTDPSVAPTTHGAICCVARRDLSDELLQHALEYVCRVRADCCDLNNNVRNHASYTSSCSNKNKTRAPPPASCSGIGTAAVFTTDPCYVICIYPSSPTSNTPPARTYIPPPTTPPAPAPAPAPSTPPTTMIVATPPTSNTAHAPPLAAPPTSRNGVVNTQENSAASLHSLAAPSHILFLLLFLQFIFI